MSKTTTTTKVDVLVSGAGPVGLFFSYQMATRGHSVICVDPKPGPTDQSRAILVTSRTMEILEGKGFAAEFLSEAFVSSGIRMFRNGVVTGQVEANGDTSFSHMTIVMQGITERIFNNRLEQDTECRVQWNTELLSYTQDDEFVTATIRNNITNEEQVIQSKYIVGADGSHSRVRKGNCDWTYEGVAISTKFGLADLTLKGDKIKDLMDKMNTFNSGTNIMGVVRINPIHETGDDSHVFRLFGNLEAYKKSSKDQKNPNHGLVKTQEEPPSLEFIQSWLDRMTAPLKFECSNLIWSSYFRINERIANGFRKKRAFLIGDAAHCHSPAGGQGMNLGVQDADNLAWKMSDVLNELASDPEKLLDSYNVERFPHAKSTIDTTSAATQAGLTGGDFIANCRAMLLSTALMLPQLRQFAFKNVMQQFVTNDPKSEIMGTSDKGLLQVGQFLPDSGSLRRSFVPKKSNNYPPRMIQRNTIRELLIGNEKYAAIFVGTCFSGSLPNLDLIEKFWKDTRKLPIRRFIIQSIWHSHLAKYFPDYIEKEEESIAEESFYNEERIDLPISLTNRVGLLPLLNSLFAATKPPSVLCIVRPDLYVAHVKLINNESDLDNALSFFTNTFA